MTFRPGIPIATMLDNWQVAEQIREKLRKTGLEGADVEVTGFLLKHMAVKGMDLKDCLPDMVFQLSEP